MAKIKGYVRAISIVGEVEKVWVFIVSYVLKVMLIIYLNEYLFVV
jgi:hypothetical protein